MLSSVVSVSGYSLAKELQENELNEGKRIQSNEKCTKNSLTTNENG